ncbi:MAG: hypothetical protein OXH15_05830 [Gammaproteobacteria bacterium]|nr:hypothetical protein [Gammaproteobacteria bacterium]
MLRESGVQEVTSMLFRTDALKTFGEPGVASLDKFINCVREFFRAVPPDGLSTRFVFVYPVAGSSDTLHGMRRMCEVPVRREGLAGYRRRIEGAATVVVATGPDETYDLATPVEPLPLAVWSETALVFWNEAGIDRFVIGGQERKMPQLATGARSNYAAATIGDLEEALETYRREAEQVSSDILEKVWVGGRNGPRLVFGNRPESTMRRSLERFLQTRMRGDVSVRAEHNTDETRPVDVAVNWFGAKLRALIEIKWMGDSLRKGATGKPFTPYGPARVASGADQLADYLDREASSDSQVSLRGYIAVFDGRRRHVVDPTTPIPQGDALYYRDKDVALAAQHASGQTGIAALVRYFLEPRPSSFAPPAESA